MEALLRTAAAGVDARRPAPAPGAPRELIVQNPDGQVGVALLVTKGGDPYADAAEGIRPAFALRSEVQRLEYLRDVLLSLDAMQDDRLEAAHRERFEGPTQRAKSWAITGLGLDIAYFVSQSVALAIVAHPELALSTVLSERNFLIGMVVAISVAALGLLAIFRTRHILLSVYILALCATVVLLIKGTYLVWVFLLFRAGALVTAIHLRLLWLRAARSRAAMRSTAAATSHHRAALARQMDTVITLGTAIVHMNERNAGPDASPEVEVAIQELKVKLRMALQVLRVALAGGALPTDANNHDASVTVDVSTSPHLLAAAAPSTARSSPTVASFPAASLPAAHAPPRPLALSVRTLTPLHVRESGFAAFGFGGSVITPRVQSGRGLNDHTALALAPREASSTGTSAAPAPSTTGAAGGPPHYTTGMGTGTGMVLVRVGRCTATVRVGGT